jgi:mannan endo-1,4-beta-mannosidase
MIPSKSRAAGLRLLAAILCAAPSAAQAAASGSPGFVYASAGKFMLDGVEFRFEGTNNYYLHYESDAMVDDVIDGAAAMGLKVLRIWAFFDGDGQPNVDHSAYMQSAPGAYGIPAGRKALYDGFERLDHALARAKERGLRIILVAGNNWNDFGGVGQYQQWLGLASRDDFFRDPRARAAYKAYLKHLAERVNRYSGVAYKDDPTIFAWELMNEPRCESDKSGDTLVAWAAEMSAYVKSIAPRQMVSVGDEGFFARQGEAAAGLAGDGAWVYNGFSGVDSDRLLGIPSVDFGTYHLYPEGWGIQKELVEAWGRRYILDHIQAGKEAGKPVVLEEYGIAAGGGLNRRATYDLWNKTVLEAGGAGSMFWILTGVNDKELKDSPPGDGIYDDYDGFRVMNDKGPVASLLSAYAGAFSGTGAPPSAPRAYLLAPGAKVAAKDFYRVRVLVMPEGRKVKSARLFANGEAKGLLQYNGQQDVYRLNYDLRKEKNDSPLRFKAQVALDDGTTLETEEIPVVVSNAIVYELYKTFDFKDGIPSVRSLGGYQADLKSIGHSALNGGMLRVDADFPGKNSWEEVKVQFPSPTFPEAGVAAKIEFTVYLRKDLASIGTGKDESQKLPGVEPYIAFDPGWEKRAIGENNAFLSSLEIVKLDDGAEYYKQVVKVEMLPNEGRTGLAICPTLGWVKYSGPVYIDDLRVYEKAK